MKGVDAAIGKIRTAYMNAGILSKTVFVVTSDHGMVPNSRPVGDLTVITDALTSNGVYAQTLGEDYGHIWLNKPAKAAAVAQTIARNAGSEIFAVYYKSNSNGQYSYLAAREPAVPGAYEYLLSTYAGPTGPDVVVMVPENGFLARPGYLLNSSGDHWQVTWNCQHVPLIISGCGVKSGKVSDFPARLVDIAPTLLADAKIEPQGMDGVVLADCLWYPSTAQVKAQKAIAARLTTAQDALIEISTR
jgi:arylsulfatase A-like enzyme